MPDGNLDPHKEIKNSGHGTNCSKIILLFLIDPKENWLSRAKIVAICCV